MMPRILIRIHPSADLGSQEGRVDHDVDFLRVEP
jgi:hypothetical protein